MLFLFKKGWFKIYSLLLRIKIFVVFFRKCMYLTRSLCSPRSGYPQNTDFEPKIRLNILPVQYTDDSWVNIAIAQSDPSVSVFHLLIWYLNNPIHSLPICWNQIMFTFLMLSVHDIQCAGTKLNTQLQNYANFET